MLVGLDRLRDAKKIVQELASRRVGLLAHPASVDRELCHISSVLAGLGIKPAILFGPEHGFGGEAQDMIGVADATDRHGTKIISLYGDKVEDLSPRAEHFADIEVLVIDLADVGSRYYTFIWTALLAARAAARAGVEIIVLDRPNPIGGLSSQMAGKSQQTGFFSFVGLEPISVRHSLTLAEIVAYFTKDDNAALRVLGVRDWNRAELAHQWDRPFVMTSPNMPTADVALVYPGGCLIEGTNLSEGRGTTRPFEIVGAPFIDGLHLAAELTKSKLAGFVARPLTFTPTFHKHAGKVCGGVQIHVTDATKFDPYAVYLALVEAANRIGGPAFKFRTERYEFIDDIPAFDLLTGSAVARTAIEKQLPLADWLPAIVEPSATAREQWESAVAAARDLEVEV